MCYSSHSMTVNGEGVRSQYCSGQFKSCQNISYFMKQILDVAYVCQVVNLVSMPATKLTHVHEYLPDILRLLQCTLYNCINGLDITSPWCARASRISFQTKLIHMSEECSN